MKGSAGKRGQATQDSGRVLPGAGQESSTSSKGYEKKLLQFTEAFVVCGCSEDTALAAAGDGYIRAYVIAQDWAIAGSEQRILDFVEVPASCIRLARGRDTVAITDATLSNGEKVKFKDRQDVNRGALYFSAEDCRRFNAENARPVTPTEPFAPTPGPRAERNLEKTIGAMAVLIAEMKPEQYRYNGKPNAEAIAKALVTQLDEQGKPDSGLSVRAIQDRILNALKVLSS